MAASRQYNKHHYSGRAGIRALIAAAEPPIFGSVSGRSATQTCAVAPASVAQARTSRSPVSSTRHWFGASRPSPRSQAAAEALGDLDPAVLVAFLELEFVGFVEQVRNLRHRAAASVGLDGAHHKINCLPRKNFICSLRYRGKELGRTQ